MDASASVPAASGADSAEPAADVPLSARSTGGAWVGRLSEELQGLKLSDSDDKFSLEVVTVNAQVSDAAFSASVKLTGPPGSPFESSSVYDVKGVVTQNVLGRNFDWEIGAPLTCQDKPDILLSGSSKVFDASVLEVRLDVGSGSGSQKIRFRPQPANPAPDAAPVADRLATPMSATSSNLPGFGFGRAQSGLSGKHSGGSGSEKPSSGGSGSGSPKKKLRSQKSISQLAAVGASRIEDMDNLDRAHHRLRSQKSGINISKNTQGLTGEQHMARMASSQKTSEGMKALMAMQDEAHRATLSTRRQQKTRGVNRDLLRVVVLEDEFQLMSCLSLPSTVFFFLIFAAFFNAYYDVPDMYMTESIVRQSVCESAQAIEEPVQIFDWMRDDYLPYFLGMNDRTAPSTAESARFMDLVGGVVITTAKAKVSPCSEDSDGWESVIDCHGSFHNADVDLDTDSLAGVRTHLAFMEEQLQDNPIRRRLDSGIGAEEQVKRVRRESIRPRAAFSGGRAPGKAKRLPKRHWPRDEQPSPWRRAVSQVKEPPRRRQPVVHHLDEHYNCTAETPGRRMFHGVLDTRPGAHAARRLKTTRPEMRTSLPSPLIKDGVDELIIPMSYGLASAQGLVNEMERQQIIGRDTLFFSLNTMIHNDKIGKGLAALVVVHFRFSRGGNVYAQCQMNSLVLEISALGYMCAVVWILCLAAASASLGMNAFQSCKSRSLARHFQRFRNLLEYFLVGFGWFVAFSFVRERVGIAVFQSAYKEYVDGRMAIISNAEMLWGALVSFDKEDFPPMFEDIRRTAVDASWLQTWVTYYLILLLSRYVLASRGQPKLALVVNTMRAASVDLFHLLVVFGIIFAAYVLSGHILFGRRMDEFATMNGALAECMYIVLAREYEWDRFTEQDVFTVMIWVWSFVLLVVIVLVNIMLAMIFQNYGEIRDSVSKTHTLWNTCGQLVTRMKLVGTWVTNPEMIRWLVNEVHVDEVTVEMIREQFPTMPNKQLHHIFESAGTRHNLLLIRGNYTILPETMASTLVGLDQMRGGVRLMNTEFDKIMRTRRRVVPDKEISEDMESDVSSELDFGDESNAELEPESLEQAPKDMPKWLRVGLMPHLREGGKKLAAFDETMKGIDTQAQSSRCWGDDKIPLPIPSPSSSPLAYTSPRPIARGRSGADGRPGKPEPVLGTTGGRNIFVAEVPPHTLNPPDLSTLSLICKAVEHAQAPQQRTTEHVEVSPRSCCGTI